MKLENSEVIEQRSKEKEAYKKQFDVINESFIHFVSLANDLAKRFRNLDECYTEDCDLERGELEEQMAVCYKKLKFELDNLNKWEKGLNSFLSKK